MISITRRNDPYFATLKITFYLITDCTIYFLIAVIFILLFYSISGCSHDSILKETVRKQTVAKIVIILIDAWQEQFFYGRKTMQFLHQLTSDGQAVAFIAHVQTPTVTMPRIKVGSYFSSILDIEFDQLNHLIVIFQAVTTGMVPSFVDIVMNFASTSISNDNIIDQLNGKGYR